MVKVQLLLAPKVRPFEATHPCGPGIPLKRLETRLVMIPTAARLTPTYTWYGGIHLYRIRLLIGAHSSSPLQVFHTPAEDCWPGGRRRPGQTPSSLLLQANPLPILRT